MCSSDLFVRHAGTSLADRSGGAKGSSGSSPNGESGLVREALSRLLAEAGPDVVNQVPGSLP